MRVTGIHYSREQRRLTLTFDDGVEGSVDAEYLRVHSPSAEVRGHGSQTPALVTGKAQVAITAIQPVGHYAIQLVFDDGHDSGLYTWSYLRELLDNASSYWEDYLERLAQAGESRQPDVQVLAFKP